VTTGAITNRIDRLEQRGFVERVGAADRRKVIVRLTPTGLSMVEQVVTAHLDTERALLASLSDRQRTQLSALLRSVLVDLGDVPAD
jgi:DNA-binding MarR family transcriptional regulator